MLIYISLSLFYANYASFTVKTLSGDMTPKGQCLFGMENGLNVYGRIPSMLAWLQATDHTPAAKPLAPNPPQWLQLALPEVKTVSLDVYPTVTVTDSGE